MKSSNRSIIFAGLVAALIAAPALADSSHDTTNNNQTYNNQTYNQGGQGGKGVGIGVGVGIGQGGQGGKGGQGGAGGSATQQQQQQQSNTNNVGNGLGNFSPSASAKGGEANASAKGGEATSISGSSSKSDSKSSSGAIAGSASGSNSGGNSMSLTQNVEASNLRDLAPGIALGSIYPSANCHGTSNVGGSGPGFSIGFGSSWKDDDCGIRETARSFHSMGMTKDAVAVLCSSTYAAKAPACQQAAPAAKPAAKAEVEAAPVAQAPNRTTDETATRYVANGQVWTRPNAQSDWTLQR